MSKQIVNGRLQSPASNNVSDTTDGHIDCALEISATARNVNNSISNNSNTNDHSNSNKENIDSVNKDGNVDHDCNVHKTSHQYNFRLYKNSGNNINNYNNDIDIGKDTA